MKWLLSVIVAFAFVTSSAQAQTIFVVRHAEKSQADGAAKDPVLSGEGRGRAEALGRLLADAEIRTIYVSEFKRTQETAAPLAKLLGIAVTIVPAASIESLVAKLKAATGNALIVGHSNTIPEILKGLGVADAISFGEDDYDNLFVVTPSEKPRLTRLHYR